MSQCQMCEYGDPTYKRNRKEDRRTNPFIATGKAECSKPKYNGRTYNVKNNKTDCPFYKKREREAGQNEQ